MQLFPVRSNVARAKAIIACFIGCLAVDASSAMGDIWQYILLNNAANGIDNQSLLTLSDSIVRTVAITQILMLLIAAVLFIRWFRRAYYNLHIYNPSAASLDEGWAAGSWFVPFQNLVRPFRIMREIWTGSQDTLGCVPSSRVPNGILNAWWTMWLLNNALGQITFRLSSKADDIPSYQTALAWSFASDIVSIIALILAIRIIRKVAADEVAIENATEADAGNIFGLYVDTELQSRTSPSSTEIF